MDSSEEIDRVVLVDDNNNDAFGERLKSIKNGFHGPVPSSHGTDYDFKFIVKWQNVIGMALFHAVGFYGIWLKAEMLLTGRLYELSIVASTIYLMIMFSGIGVTAGTHRLWAHRSYKAKTPLKILLMIMQTSALQNDVIDWCRDHRVHHKYSETDADPHNANRGFFFAHIGWLMAKKHPLVIKRGKETDLSDLEADPILRFQHKYYWYGAIFMAIIVPFCVGYFLVGESFKVSFCCFVVSRLIFLTHGTSLVNSAAHMIGNRPYDVTINPCENRFVSTLAFGEGFHNYHHVFPWDYSTSEFGMQPNFTTIFIDLMAKIGWAYDLKKASPEMVHSRSRRTGPDGFVQHVMHTESRLG